MCFSNEFSTFSHKTIYFDFFVDEDEDPLKEVTSQEATALTRMADFCRNIHIFLRKVIDAQVRGSSHTVLIEEKRILMLGIARHISV